jgi:hypothetical protein
MLGETEYRETVKELSSQINQFQSDNATNQQMRQTRGRLHSSVPTSLRTTSSRTNTRG